MTESFEDYDNILRNWAKIRIKKKSCQSIEQEAGKIKKKPFLRK